MTGASTVADFEAFYRANVRVVFSFAAQRLGPADAEDVTAEVFQAAALAHRDHVGRELTPGWLISVCKNKVIDRWRAQSIRKSKAHLVVERFGRTSAPAADHSIDLRDTAVLSALDGLNDRHRTLLILHHIDGMPIAELADATGQSKVAIESALARARRAFRKVYDDAANEGGRHEAS